MRTSLYAATAALTSAATVSSFCTDFQVVPQSYSERGSTTNGLTNLTTSAPYNYRISSGFICNDTTAAQAPPNTCIGGTCLPLITNGTVVPQEGISNISLSDSDKSAAFALISKVANIPFPTSASTTLGAPGAETQDSCISPTWAGYITFSPLVNCVNGILSGCAGSSVEDGTGVRMCAPLTNGDQLAGAVFFRQTSDDVANALGPPPNPETPEDDVFFSTSYVSPSPIPTSVAATLVPGQPGDASAPASPTAAA